MKEYPLIAEAHNLSIGYKGKRGANAVVHSGINFSLHGGELVACLVPMAPENLRCSVLWLSFSRHWWAIYH